MKQRKPFHLTIKTPFWTASIPATTLALVLGIYMLVVIGLFLTFRILWIALLSSFVGFVVFAALMPKPVAPPSDEDGMAGVGTRSTPKKPAPGAHKRQKSGRK